VPGSESLAPLTEKRPRNTSESDAATGSNVWDDAGTVKRAKTQEVFDFGPPACEEQLAGCFPFTASHSLALGSSYEGLAAANTFPPQNLWLQGENFVPWGLLYGCGAGEDDSVGEGVWDQMNMLGGVQPNLLETLPSIRMPQLAFNGAFWPEHGHLSASGLDSLHTAHLDFVSEHGGELAGFNLDDSGWIPDLELIGIKREEEPEIGSEVIATTVEAVHDLNRDVSEATPSQSPAENMSVLLSHCVDVEYDTCFGVVRNSHPRCRAWNRRD
jgi:hypothetical protein